MSSRLTEKEAKLITTGMANVDGGPAAILKLVIILTAAFNSILKTLPQIDFSKVFGPAGYKDATNAKIMLGRLLSKIANDGLEGTPGRYKSGTKAKKASAEGTEDAQSSPSTGATPIKPTRKRKAAGKLADEDTQSSPSAAATPVKPAKKRKAASEFVEEDTPTKHGRFFSHQSLNGSLTGPEDDEAAGIAVKKENVQTTTEEEGVL